MSLFRTFIAIEVGNDVRARATSLVRKLQRSDAKTSWTKLESLHLTLKFLGDTPDVKIPDVCQAIARAAARSQPINASFGSAGAFPNVDRPKTIWIGVDEGFEELCALQASLEEELLELGFPREPRKFKPHVTLGRVRQAGPTQVELGALLAQHHKYSGGKVTVNEVLAMASFLDSDGPSYQVLGRARLGT